MEESQKTSVNIQTELSRDLGLTSALAIGVGTMIAVGHSICPQILFGSIPEMIAKHSDQPVILVKHYHPVKALLGRVMGE
jgi:hypothetical protein